MADTQIVPLFGNVEIIDRRQAGFSPLDRMQAWIEAMHLWLEGRRSANTRRAYRSAWEHFLAYTSKQPWEISRTDVARWVYELEQQRLSDCTIAQRVAAISSFYQYARDEYEITLPDGSTQPLHDANPAASKSLRPKITPYGKATYLSTDEARALLRAIRRDTVQGLRDFALFLLYLSTGRRNTEARTLKWGQISESGGKIWYRWSGKGKKDQRYELPHTVYFAIREYLQAAGRLESMRDEDFIFTALGDQAGRLPNVDPGSFDPFAQPLSMRTVGDLLRKYCRRAGLVAEKVKVHSLRHTAAMLRKAAGDDVEQICALLGHSSIAVTQIYLHTVEGQKDTSWSKVEALLGL